MDLSEAEENNNVLTENDWTILDLIRASDDSSVDVRAIVESEIIEKDNLKLADIVFRNMGEYNILIDENYLLSCINNRSFNVFQLLFEMTKQNISERLMRHLLSTAIASGDTRSMEIIMPYTIVNEDTAMQLMGLAAANNQPGPAAFMYYHGILDLIRQKKNIDMEQFILDLETIARNRDANLYMDWLRTTPEWNYAVKDDAGFASAIISTSTLPNEGEKRKRGKEMLMNAAFKAIASGNAEEIGDIVLSNNWTDIGIIILLDNALSANKEHVADAVLSAVQEETGDGFGWSAKLLKLCELSAETDSLVTVQYLAGKFEKISRRRDVVEELYRTLREKSEKNLPESANVHRWLTSWIKAWYGQV